MVERARSIRAPLAAALDAELRRLDHRVAQAFCILFAGGILGGIGAALSFSRSLGIACSIASAILALPFVAAQRSLASRPLSRTAALGLSAVEAALPWLFLGVLVFAQGAEYALASWLPPLVFAGVMVATVARLRPMRPIVLGAVGAASHLLVYFVLAVPRLAGEGAALFARPPIQVSRAISFFVGGLVGALVTRELRRAIGRAEAKLRSEELFGKYRLVRRIGAGGAGIVHEALYCPEGGFERRVAVKVLHEHLASEPAFLDGFRREAELGARLAHPNVVTTHDFGRHEGVVFMAMELVDGLTLARLLTRASGAKAAIPVDVAAFLGRGVLAGLDHAHDGVRGDDGAPLRILHRDVCPQNLLVSKLGEVKLNDFGIARVLGAAAASTTRTVAGHEAYMAPEQARGQEMTLRADLFAAGVVLWEVLAGRRLFARSNNAATLLAVLEDEIPPIAGIRADVDPSWDAFFARALARDPEERFPSARAMSEALGALPGARSDDAQAKLGELMTRLAVATEAREPQARDPAPSIPTLLT